ncbi:mitochondrial folate carrier protein [Xylaria bambusicola]|uniref:mitochondrial folate carrier protein n=1 Tax=Xylaria bambusicola TaxID=326684 RepID=UPI0020084B1D|nr:mitochondrial folate carrier protein [Xylaria bambusicola]KAI0514394.1 mitochondrial folate carrier protein [Xylaria bambusicola]
MTRHDAGLPPAFVESIAGLTAGSVSTLVVHPLDIVKTRMQIHRSNAATSQALTTISVLRGLTRTPHPVAALYRGLTPNLLGNASSWASFFFFKARAESAILAVKGRSRADHDAVALTPQDYFVASGVAGMCTQVLTNPIWVLKTRMLSSDRGAVGAYPSMWAGAAQLLRTEGWRGFYRGLGISLFGVSHGAVQFAVYDPLKQMYFRRRERLAGATLRSDDREKYSMTNEATLVISSVSKLVAGAVTYPYQVIRSRLQNYDAEERFGRGIRGVVKRTWTEEGWRGFYRGIIPGVVRVMPATWVTFLVYENTKFYLPKWTNDPSIQA